MMASVAAASGLEETARLPATAQGMLHDLHVHQLELEIQNEELRQAYGDLDAIRVKYFDLYEMAPVGYCSVTENGLIVQSNLATTTMLGVAKSQLFQKPISRLIFSGDQNIYYAMRKRVLSGEQPQTCEVRMRKSDATIFWAHVTAAVAKEGNRRTIHLVLEDITERKKNADLIQVLSRGLSHRQSPTVICEGGCAISRIA